MELQNKNDKQIYFNQIKGVISELNDADKYCSITLIVGHENTRDVNISMNKAQFDQLKQKHTIGDKVTCGFFLVSNKKYDRWYTSALLLSIGFD